MTEHWSSCAVHNEPAYPAGPCDCGGYDPSRDVTDTSPSAVAHYEAAARKHAETRGADPDHAAAVYRAILADPGRLPTTWPSKAQVWTMFAVNTWLHQQRADCGGMPPEEEAMMPTNPSEIITPTVGIGTGSAADEMIAEIVERELPGFWAFLKARHPEFATCGAPDGPPVGFIHAFQVHNAMAETIPVYVAELKARMAND